LTKRKLQATPSPQQKQKIKSTYEQGSEQENHEHTSYTTYLACTSMPG
jgi:hypothetical protein